MGPHLYSLRTYLCSAFSFSSCALRFAASSRFLCVAALLSRLQAAPPETIVSMAGRCATPSVDPNHRQCGMPGYAIIVQLILLALTPADLIPRLLQYTNDGFTGVKHASSSVAKPCMRPTLPPHQDHRHHS